MSTKRQISPSGASRALKQKKLHFGKKMAIPSANQPRRSMTTKEDKAPATSEGLESGRDKSDGHEHSPAADLTKYASKTEPHESGSIYW